MVENKKVMKLDASQKRSSSNCWNNWKNKIIKTGCEDVLQSYPPIVQGRNMATATRQIPFVLWPYSWLLPIYYCATWYKDTSSTSHWHIGTHREYETRPLHTTSRQNSRTCGSSVWWFMTCLRIKQLHIILYISIASYGWLEGMIKHTLDQSEQRCSSYIT